MLVGVVVIFGRVCPNPFSGSPFCIVLGSKQTLSSYIFINQQAFDACLSPIFQGLQSATHIKETTEMARSGQFHS